MDVPHSGYRLHSVTIEKDSYGGWEASINYSHIDEDTAADYPSIEDAARETAGDLEEPVERFTHPLVYDADESIASILSGEA